MTHEFLMYKQVRKYPSRATRPNGCILTQMWFLFFPQPHRKAVKERKHQGTWSVRKTSWQILRFMVFRHIPREVCTCSHIWSFPGEPDEVEGDCLIRRLVLKKPKGGLCGGGSGGWREDLRRRGI